MEFAACFARLLTGAMADEEIADFLTVLADRGETVDDIVTAVTMLRRQAVRLHTPPDTIDVCGTGGDHAGTLNVSTAVALLVAARGVPVAKHGNRAASSRSGATDVVQALGIATDLAPTEAERQLAETGITFLSAARYYPVLARLAPIRKAIGRRTLFNLLGPLLNPAHVTRQLIGVYSAGKIDLMAQVLVRLGCEHAWVVHGGGLDELTVTGPSTTAIIKDGNVTLCPFDPLSFGIARADPAALQGGSPAENAAALIRLLEGEKGAYRDIVLVNGAAALVVAGKAESIPEGLAQARAGLDDGQVLTLLRRLQQESPP